MTDKGAIAKEIQELSEFVLTNTDPIRTPQKENEISIAEFVEQVGCTERIARLRLNKMVSKGLMARRMASNGNKPPCSVYWKIEK